MFFNRLQILEHSRGAEGLLSGDSEFRKATLILMGTWFPFPAWFLLSPEGFGVVEDITLVQFGWAFLNVLSKFTLIFYLQRIKDNYCSRLKVTREMKGHSPAGMGSSPRYVMDDFEDDKSELVNEITGELRACVVETMNFLGMAENTERFLRLLTQAHITTLDDIVPLTKEDCDKLLLPHDLITALQKRHRVWALEMIDDAEKCLEASERHYHDAEIKLRRDQTKEHEKRTLENIANRPQGFDDLGNVDPLRSGMPMVKLQMQGQSGQEMTRGPMQMQSGQEMMSGPMQVQSGQEMMRGPMQLQSGQDFGSNPPFQSVLPFQPAVNGFMSSTWPMGSAPEMVTNDNLERFERSFLKMEQFFEKYEQKFDQVATIEQRLTESLDHKLQKFEDVVVTVDRRMGSCEEKFDQMLSSGEKQMPEGKEAYIVEKLEAWMKRAEESNKYSEDKLKQAEERRSNDFAEIVKAVDRSQTLIEGKVEYVMSNQGQQSRELFQTDVRRLVQQLTEQVLQRTDASQDGSNNSVQRVQKRMDDVVLKLQELQTAQQGVDVWAQKIMQENKAIQSRIESLQDSQSKRWADAEETICRRLAKVMTEGMESVASSCSTTTQTSIDKLGASVKMIPATQSKLEQNLLQLMRDMKEETSRELSGGMNSLGNSLGLQLESMKAAQHGQYVESEKGLKCLVENMLQQSQYDADRMKRMESNITETTERASRSQLESLKDMQKRVELNMQDHTELGKKTHQTMSKVLDHTGEANIKASQNAERLETLSQLLGVCREGDLGGRPQSSRNKRSSTRGDIKDYPKDHH
jgi:hypothetical protein